MGQYRAPKGTQVSTVGPDGEAIVLDFKDAVIDVTDPALDSILQGLAADENNAVRSVKSKAKEE